MEFIEAIRWNGQFQYPKVIAQIRKKIAGKISCGECVTIDFHGAKGLTPEIVQAIIARWPDEKFRVGNNPFDCPPPPS